MFYDIGHFCSFCVSPILRERGFTLKRLSLLVILVFISLLFVSAHVMHAQVPSSPSDACPELFFSEYVEGSSYNKALEIYNCTGHSVDLSAYRVAVSFNGGSARKSMALAGSLPSGAVYVLANSKASAAVLAKADATNGAVIDFNGDDAVILEKQGNPVDVIGQVGMDPGSQWGSDGTTTKDHTLRRKSDICRGDANGSDSFDPAVEWNGYPKNTFDGLGSHTADCTGSTPAATPVSTSTPTASPTLSPITPIHAIQGAGHISPYVGREVRTSGIVTIKTSKGFYMQDPTPDDDIATSEGIYVYANASLPVAPGDLVSVTGRVNEYYPGGRNTGNLSTTEIGGSVTASVLSHGHPLPAPVVIGASGRRPPTTVIEDDATGNVETSGVFDPTHDGIDFYESLEGMLVQVNHAAVVGPTSHYGEIVVVGDNGVGAGVRSEQKGLVIRQNDFNPERLIIDDALVKHPPNVNVGDFFTTPITAVVSYSYGNFKLLNTFALPTPVSGGIVEETAPSTAPSTLSVVAFNVDNLDPGDNPGRFQSLAADIVSRLRAPDIIGLEEMQDNSGPTDDGVVAAGWTFGKLIAAIAAAGGPNYAYREIDPQNNHDGGQPGGNIRVGFLFRPDRVQFIDKPGGTATNSVSVVDNGHGPELSFSPGRIDPGNAAFIDSRKPLAGEFIFQGRRLIVIANHFCSKWEDDPLFGRIQPPVQSSETQRVAQGRVVNAFVRQILAVDAHADVIVLGDLNDYEFSNALGALKGSALTDLADQVPLPARYTYIHNGNSETLDHILVSPALAMPGTSSVQDVHANAEFYDQAAERASDHDPVLVRIAFGRRFRLWQPVVQN